MTTIIDGIEGLKSKVGEHLGYSDYLEITQERVNQFAQATGDFQWIHVDVERAKDGPFGGTIAHGYLTLALGPLLGPMVYRVDGVQMALNYGCGKVRFPSPVPVGAKMRVGVKVLQVEEVTGGVQVTYDYTFEAEGASKPCCVAEIIHRLYV